VAKPKPTTTRKRRKRESISTIWYRQPIVDACPPTFHTPDGKWKIQILYESESRVIQNPSAEYGGPDLIRERVVEKIYAINCVERLIPARGR
jgi:hypothetical protein